LERAADAGNLPNPVDSLAAIGYSVVTTTAERYNMCELIAAAFIGVLIYRVFFGR
jgi:hypothetical protein